MYVLSLGQQVRQSVFKQHHRRLELQHTRDASQLANRNRVGTWGHVKPGMPVTYGAGQTVTTRSSPAQGRCDFQHEIPYTRKSSETTPTLIINTSYNKNMARESPNSTTTPTQHACPDTVLIKPSQPAQALKASAIINTLSYTSYSNRTGTDGPYLWTSCPFRRWALPWKMTPQYLRRTSHTCERGRCSRPNVSC